MRLKNLLCTSSCLTAALLTTVPVLGWANPYGGVVSAGQATISESGQAVDIHQQSDKAVIDWRGFDIAPGETTTFHQPTTNSITLNRVNSNAPSVINGTLSANGRLILVNQNGIVFGQGAQVDASGIIASTADIGNDQFMNSDRLHFDKPGHANARIVNEGRITAKNAGLVGLVAPHVENSGVITAKLGRVQLASGDAMTLDMYGDGLMNVAVSDQVRSQLVKNTGAINAEGGTIALTAAAGKHIVNGLIAQSGALNANSVGQRDGTIIIGAEGSNATSKSGASEVALGGNLTVRGHASGERGGKVTVTADRIVMAGDASIDASGATGGGTVRIGGEYLGKGDTQRAKTSTIERGATITADALEQGDGGEVIVWSDDTTKFEGNVSARGGSNGGNGGFVESSGKITLQVGDAARVDTRAAYGEAGTWLLDPQNFRIAASGGDISGSTLTTNLTGGNVTILSSAGGGAGSGDIIVDDTVNWSANRLTMTAARDILVKKEMNATGTAALTLNPATANGGDAAVSSGALKMAFGPTGTFAGKINYSGSGSLLIRGTTYTVINSLGTAGSTTVTTLQGMNGNLAGNYVLGSDIDASATSGWNSGSGFAPIGGASSASPFTGRLEGFGHVVSGLYSNRSLAGLFGYTRNTAISNLGTVSGNIIGTSAAGGIISDEFSLSGTSLIRNSFSTNNVTSTNSDAGGLVGSGFATIRDSYYDLGTVTSNRGTGSAGGLIGEADGTTIQSSYSGGTIQATGSNSRAGGLVGSSSSSTNISNSYSFATVTSPRFAGGLYGSGVSLTISNSYAVGSVSAPTSGGLVPSGSPTITNSFWDTTTTGVATSSGGGTGRTTAQMQTLATYTAAGWNIDSNPAGTSTWYLAAGAYPVLRNLAVGIAPLGTITITALAQSLGYGIAPNSTATLGTTFGFACSDGCASSVITGGPTLSFTGGPGMSSSGNYRAGSWTINVAGATASNGYTINYVNGTLTISPRNVTISGLSGVDTTYNGTTAATLAGTASITGGGIISGDTVGLGGAASGTFANKNVGTNKAITLAGLTLTGTDASNYTISGPVSPLTASILARALNVVGVTASDKEYDRTTTATLSGGSLGAGVIGGDTVTLNTAGATGSFADRNVGTNKAVTASGYALSGADAGNYTLSQPTGLTASITAKLLNIIGVTASDKEYDHTTTATLSGGSLGAGVIGGDTVTLNTAGATGSFGDRNVGTNKAVTASGYALSGADAGNYTLSQPTGLTASITAKLLSIIGVTASDKEYDRTTTATLSGGSLGAGVIGGDTVTLNTAGATGSFGDRNVGTGKAVMASGYALSGADAGNYTLSQPTGLTASITAKLLSIIGVTASDKEYDRTTTATLSGGSLGAGVIGGDTVTLNTAGATGSFGDRNVGTNKAVTASGYALSGADAGNYTLSQPTGLTASITAKTLNVQALAQSVTYGDLAPLTYNATGLISGDAMSGSLTRAAGSNVGTYAIGLGSLTAGSNYAIAYTGADYVIIPASLSVRATDTSKNMGTADPVFAYTYTGLRNGDTSTGFSGSLMRDAGEAVGGYRIRQGNLAAMGNYTIGAFQDGMLSINATAGDAVTSSPVMSVPETVEIVSQKANQIEPVILPANVVASTAPVVSTATVAEAVPPTEPRSMLKTLNQCLPQISAWLNGGAGHAAPNCSM